MVQRFLERHRLVSSRLFFRGAVTEVTLLLSRCTSLRTCAQKNSVNYSSKVASTAINLLDQCSVLQGSQATWHGRSAKDAEVATTTSPFELAEK